MTLLKQSVHRRMIPSIIAAILSFAPLCLDAAEPQVIPDGGGALESWVLAGPFPSPPLSEAALDGSRRAGWNIDYLAPIGGEGTATLTVGEPIEYLADGQTVTVAPRAATSGYLGVVDLVTGLDIDIDDGMHQIAYAQTLLRIDAPGTYYFFLGADDAAKLLIDGEVLHSKWVFGQGITPGQYEIAKDLNPGVYNLLVKIDNNSGPWGFSLEIYPEQYVEAYRTMQRIGPEDFPKFEFAGFEGESDVLNAYTWHFFSKKMGYFTTLFVREYVTFSEAWMANAIEATKNIPVQEVFRRWGADTRVDPDGYVQSMQHFSHSHDGGWPFPLWPQIYGGAAGYTHGWHFQDGGQGWVWEYNMVQPNTVHTGRTAAELWTLSGATSQGIVNSAWRVTLAEENATLDSPEIVIDSYNAPFMQLRWRRDPVAPPTSAPYLQWKRTTDDDWSHDRMMLIFDYDSTMTGQTRMRHSILPLYRHPEWNGTIKQFRLVLAPGEKDTIVDIDSFFPTYDTRKPYNNLLYVTGAWEYFRWTGDVSYLRNEINRLRLAYRFAREQFEVDQHGHVRITWWGHDGIAGWYDDENGNRIGCPGHGIGNNYYDLLPFGWDDMYATAQYYGATLALAELEELIARNPAWALPEGGLSLDPAELRTHAERVRTVANDKFWNEETGRFFGSIDKNGRAYDFGFTFVTLEAIWYGIANDERAREAMDWISGRRIVDGDTSVGEDIYYFRFGPRATTKRNLEWYGQGWTRPEALKWGRQIQDGGAVLGMSFYDLYARLKVYGADDAWQRLLGLLEWEKEVQAAGGYREYYKDGPISLQGGGTAGGIGIDYEFLESIMPPSIVVYGFLGLDPRGDHLRIAPELPSDVPVMTLRNFLFHNVPMDISASNNSITLVLQQNATKPLRIRFDKPYMLDGVSATEHTLSRSGSYLFDKTISAQ